LARPARGVETKTRRSKTIKGLINGDAVQVGRVYCSSEEEREMSQNKMPKRSHSDPGRISLGHSLGRARAQRKAPLQQI
jgi:hypothetical protein